jgi:hypothetical protein
MARGEIDNYFSRKVAKTQSAAAFPAISLRLCAFAREIFMYQLVS